MDYLPSLEYSVDTRMKSKLALKMLSSYISKVKEKLDYFTATGKSPLLPIVNLDGIWFSVYKHRPRDVWRNTNGDLMIESENMLMTAGERRICMQNLVHRITVICLSRPERLAFLHEKKSSSKFPKELNPPKEDWSVSQLFCMLELLCSSSAKRLEAKYGKETLESLTRCDLNPLQIEKMNVLRKEMIAVQLKVDEQIKEIDKKALEKKNAIWEKKKKLFAEYNEQINDPK